MRVQKRTCLALMMAGILLVGCGGDDSDSGSSTAGGGSAGSGNAGTTIAGKVIDGYIQGAKVCLDTNSNNRCDSDELSATSAEGGSFTLSNVPSGAENQYPLVAEVSRSAKDSADSGQTLAEAGKYGFTLVTPKGAYTASSAAITPLTTLVAAEMTSSSLSLEAAQKKVGDSITAKNGIASEVVAASLMGDYASDTTAVSLGKVAQTTAQLIGAAQTNSSNTFVQAVNIASNTLAARGSSATDPTTAVDIGKAMAAGSPTNGYCASSAASGAWFCEDFDSGSSVSDSRWTKLPTGGATTIGTANGTSSYQTVGGNTFLQYDAGTSKGVMAAVTDSAFAAVTNKGTADYFVEARIMPINNSTTNKYVCMLGRYVDVNNWYGGCLNVQNSASSKVEFHKATTAGGWNRTKQFTARSIVNGVWYKLRMEMKGTTLTFYIDDELVASTTDSSQTAAGKIGFWLDNRSFAVDNIMVGDANIKPVLLSLSPTATWNAEVGDADRTVTVSATKSDSTADSYTATSSNPAVVSVTTSGATATLKAVSAGSATITFTSGSNPALTKSVAANISPAFVMPSASYGTISGKTLPAAGSTSAYVDQPLTLTFDSAPTLASTGSIRIFKKSDDTLVDKIKLTGETDTIGPLGGTAFRGVNRPLAWVSGNNLVIRPHSNKLEYGIEYYVAIADGVVSGAKLNGSTFTGLGKTANWSFTTKSAPATTLTTLTVDDDGTTADFRTVQGALNYVMKNATGAMTVNVKNGTYQELLFLKGKNNVTIQGESRDGTVIQFDNYDTLNTGSGASSTSSTASSGGGRAMFLVETADLLTLDNLTMKNTHLKVNGLSNQAEVIYFNGTTQRLIAKNMNFISRQDTIQVNAYSWFYNTLIAGDVDFIWGSAKAALFENSEIRTVVDSTDATKGGYVIQARVAAASDKGYVFLNSSLTRESGVPDGATALGRSAGSASQYDNVAYVNCKMDTHIAATGWYTSPLPNPVAATSTSGWREYGSTKPDGAALDTSGRVTNAKTMSATETIPYLSRDQVFSAISWNPQP